MYSYDDNGTGSADASNKQWLNGGHASTDLSYALDAGDVGRVLTFEVEAKNLAGTVGNKASIDTATATGVTGGGQLIPGAVVDPLAKPVITHLKISGTLNVGENLSGRYIYDANGTGSNDASTYSWAHSGQSAAGVDQNAIVISGYVPPYLVANNDVGQVLEVSVQAKNLAGVVGNTETLDTFTSNDVNGGDGNGGVVDLNAAPAITNLLIAGKLEVGQSLTASYDFNANNGAPLDKSTYVWGYKNATAAMVGSGSTVVASGIVPPRLLLAADAGKVMEVSVQAKNLVGVVGNTETLDTFTSNDVNGGDGNGGVVDLNAAPLITNLALSGKLEVGEDLTASYAFDANNGAPGDASTYVWGHKNATAATAGSGHLVLTTGSVPAYTIGSLDAGQVLEVSVQAKNLAGVVGNTETLDTFTSNNINGGDGNGGVVNLNAAPAITNLLIAGTLEVGQSLTASYTFNANNGAPLDKSTYVWGYKGATAAMVGSGSTVVASGIVPPRLLLAADAGKVLEVSVQAKNNAATPVAGNRLTVTSSAGATGGGTGGTVVNPTAAPAITNLLIAGTLEVGQSLTASYDFNANNGAPLDKSTYVWGYKNATAAMVGSGSSIVTSGTVPARMLVAADAGQVMEVSVQAKNNAATPVVGNTLTVDSSTGATGGGTGGSVPLIDLFMKPDKILRTWNDANNYCLDKGARLPSKDELLVLFKNATSGAVPNREMCSKYDWPLYLNCGGNASDYWSSTVDSGFRSGVFLDSGHSANYDYGYHLLNVACVR
ncbi:hypothetical protein A2T76_13590 [Pseudomonas brenneri]|nr:hypothetical protein A2T76_13590 [Pseudomonas brenneri]